VGHVPTIKVLKSFYSSIQDLGRYGFRALGVPVCGAMDKLSAAYANALVGNDVNEALIEVIGGNFVFEVLRDSLIALTGADSKVTIDNIPVKVWSSVLVRKGSVVVVEPPKRGFITYIAVDGGLDAEVVMGSKSTYVRGGFGGFEGRLLKPGDVISTKDVRLKSVFKLAGSYEVPDEVVERLPDSNTVLELKATEGMHVDLLGEDFIELLKNVYVVDVSSDRMGYRLKGEPLKKASKLGRLISIPTNRGYVQIPPDGQPIVLMSDAQTTGGYAVALVLTQRSVDVLAQAQPGQKVRFKVVSVEEAEDENAKYLELLGNPPLIFKEGEESYY